jgi:AcrR family transcriptional regulator
VPTGIALRDARAQLLEAGQRILLRDGPAGLTSRSVTDEAEVAKGVLHRHFATFDGFLVALVQDWIGHVNIISTDLLARAGDATIVTNLTNALTELFEPLGLAIVRLVLSRSEVIRELRSTTPRGIPVLTEGAKGITNYLATEQQLGRIVRSAAPQSLALSLLGTGHLLFAGELGGLPDESAVREIVESIVVGAEAGFVS